MTADNGWSEPETLQLLQLWQQRSFQEQLRRQLQVRYAWQKLADQLQAGGCSRTAEQCRNKVCALVEAYKQALRGRHNRSPHFHLLHETLGSPDTPQKSDSDRLHSTSEKHRRWRRRRTEPKDGAAAAAAAAPGQPAEDERVAAGQHDENQLTDKCQTAAAADHPAENKPADKCRATAAAEPAEDERAAKCRAAAVARYKASLLRARAAREVASAADFPTATSAGRVPADTPSPTVTTGTAASNELPPVDGNSPAGMKRRSTVAKERTVIKEDNKVPSKNQPPIDIKHKAVASKKHDKNNQDSSKSIKTQMRVSEDILSLKKKDKRSTSCSNMPIIFSDNFDCTTDASLSSETSQETTKSATSVTTKGTILPTKNATNADKVKHIKENQQINQLSKNKSKTISNYHVRASVIKSSNTPSPYIQLVQEKAIGRNNSISPAEQTLESIVITTKSISASTLPTAAPIPRNDAIRERHVSTSSPVSIARQPSPLATIPHCGKPLPHICSQSSVTTSQLPIRPRSGVTCAPPPTGEVRRCQRAGPDATGGRPPVQGSQPAARAGPPPALIPIQYLSAAANTCGKPPSVQPHKGAGHAPAAAAAAQLPAAAELNRSMLAAGDLVSSRSASSPLSCAVVSPVPRKRPCTQQHSQQQPETDASRSAKLATPVKELSGNSKVSNVNEAFRDVCKINKSNPVKWKHLKHSIQFPTADMDFQKCALSTFKDTQKEAHRLFTNSKTCAPRAHHHKPPSKKKRTQNQPETLQPHYFLQNPSAWTCTPSPGLSALSAGFAHCVGGRVMPPNPVHAFRAHNTELRAAPADLARLSAPAQPSWPAAAWHQPTPSAPHYPRDMRNGLPLLSEYLATAPESDWRLRGGADVSRQLSVPAHTPGTQRQRPVTPLAPPHQHWRRSGTEHRGPTAAGGGGGARPSVIRPTPVYGYRSDLYATGSPLFTPLPQHNALARSRIGALTFK